MAVCDTSGKDRNNHVVSIPFGTFCACSVLSFICLLLFLDSPGEYTPERRKRQCQHGAEV